MLKFKAFIYRIKHWEFWHSYIVYSIPTVYFLYLAIKARSLGFFNSANPGIKNGGFGMESKYEIYQSIPDYFYPDTLFYKEQTSIHAIIDELNRSNISFPLIVKPDIGFQGKRVEKLMCLDELIHYLNHAKFNVLIQSFVDYPNEIGVFYCRYPNQPKGFITGIVYKVYPYVIGDGISTINQLILFDERLNAQSDLFSLPDTLAKSILKEGELYQLSKIGNHARGSKFIDLSHQITPALTSQMNKICSLIPLFYYGRIDVKFNTLDALVQGDDFKIIEINGSASLPTHMYDPAHSLLFAWKEMIKHFRILYHIAKINEKKGHPYLTINEVVLMVKEHIKYMRLLH